MASNPALPASDEVRAHARTVKFNAKIDKAVDAVRDLVHVKHFDTALLVVRVGDREATVKCCSCEGCQGAVYLIEGSE